MARPLGLRLVQERGSWQAKAQAGESRLGLQISGFDLLDDHVGNAAEHEHGGDRPKQNNWHGSLLWLPVSAKERVAVIQSSNVAGWVPVEV
jgi:hypothetical protein